MMRKLLLSSCFLLLSLGPILAQYNCFSFASDSVQAAYLADAEQMFARNSDQSQDFKSSPIEITSEEINPIASALLAIYGESDLPHWEEIINQYQIHTSTQISTRLVRVTADTSLLWTFQGEPQPGNFTSGNFELDRMLHVLGFQLLGIPEYIQIDGDPNIYIQFVMEASVGVHMDSFIKRVRIFNGIKAIEPLILPSQDEDYSTDISLETFEDYLEFTFILNWDCEKGVNCKKSHNWVYRVYEDCSIEFIEENGEVLPLKEVSTFLSTGLYPNPTTDEVFVQFIGPSDSEIKVMLVSALGQVIQSRVVESQSGLIEMKFSLKDQPVGLYFLGLISGEKVLTERILKR